MRYYNYITLSIIILCTQNSLLCAESIQSASTQAYPLGTSTYLAKPQQHTVTIITNRAETAIDMHASLLNEPFPSPQSPQLTWVHYLAQRSPLTGHELLFIVCLGSLIAAVASSVGVWFYFLDKTHS